jgi:hypothetical protein
MSRLDGCCIVFYLAEAELRGAQVLYVGLLWLGQFRESHSLRDLKTSYALDGDHRMETTQLVCFRVSRQVVCDNVLRLAIIVVPTCGSLFVRSMCEAFNR